MNVKDLINELEGSVKFLRTMCDDDRMKLTDVLTNMYDRELEEFSISIIGSNDEVGIEVDTGHINVAAYEPDNPVYD